MLRLRSSNLAQGCKDLWKPSKPCHVGTHWIALAEYSHMSTHLPGFQSFFRIFASFCIGQISHQQHKGWGLWCTQLFADHLGTGIWYDLYIKSPAMMSSIHRRGSSFLLPNTSTDSPLCPWEVVLLIFRPAQRVNTTSTEAASHDTIHT